MVDLKKALETLRNFVYSSRVLEAMAEAVISTRLYKPKKDEIKLVEMASQLAKSEGEKSQFFVDMTSVAMRLRLFYSKKKKSSKAEELSRSMAITLRNALERASSGKLNLVDADKSRIEALAKYWEDVASIESTVKSILLESEMKEKAESYIREGRPDEAIRDLQEILEEKKKTGDTAEIVTTLREIALVLRKKGDLEGALKYCQKAANLDPLAWFDVGFVLSNMQHYEDSIKAYKKFLKESPENAFAWNNIAWAYENLQDFSKSLKGYEKALALDPRLVQSMLGKSRILWKQGKVKQAINVSEEVLAIDPNNQLVLTNLTAFYNDTLLDYEKAAYYAEKALEQNPNDLIPRSNLAEVLITAGHYKKARFHAEEVLKLEKNPSRRLAMYFTVSSSYFFEGKVKEGIEYLEALMSYRASLPQNFTNDWAYKGISNFIAKSDIPEDYKTKLFEARNRIDGSSDTSIDE